MHFIMNTERETPEKVRGHINLIFIPIKQLYFIELG